MSRILAAVALLVALAVPVQGAADRPVGGVVVTYLSVYVPGDVMDPGQPSLAPVRVLRDTELWYVNAEDYTHSLTSDARTPDEEPMFDSGPVGFGEAAPVAGVAALPPGTYGFHCTYHPFLMHGSLEVM